jgi:protein Mpv17
VASIKKPTSSLFQQQQRQQQLQKRDPLVVRGGAVPGWAAYNDALDKKPLLTKALTSLVGWFLGDLLAQVRQIQRERAIIDDRVMHWIIGPFNSNLSDPYPLLILCSLYAQLFIMPGPVSVRRLVTLSAFGLLYHGPSGHYFYNWLDKQIEGTEAKHVAMKVAFDQLVWCPIFMTVFFTYLGLVNGDSVGTIVHKVRSDLLSACQGSWKVWPIVHAVNFKFISTKHRLVFINSVQIAFNMFLSLIGSKK